MKNIFKGERKERIMITVLSTICIFYMVITLIAVIN